MSYLFRYKKCKNQFHIRADGQEKIVKGRKNYMNHTKIDIWLLYSSYFKFKSSVNLIIKNYLPILRIVYTKLLCFWLSRYQYKHIYQNFHLDAYWDIDFWIEKINMALDICTFQKNFSDYFVFFVFCKKICLTFFLIFRH